jgi:hypothetical protein
LIKLFLKPFLTEDENINSNELDKKDIIRISGIVDLFFEVIYGTADGLHSKYDFILTELL